MIDKAGSDKTRHLTMVHLTASPCFGGVERQMLELGRELEDTCQSVFVSFQEEGRCANFVERGCRDGFQVSSLSNDAPRLRATLRELTTFMRNVQANILCCHGYKANLFGILAARQLGIPIISVSHGWTGESRRVRAYELLDRVLLRLVDRVVCVSHGQAVKVRRAGVSQRKVQVICDAVRAERFAHVQPQDRERLEKLFPEKPGLIVGAAGRLSPEKGFTHLVDAASRIVKRRGDVSFVLFGDGPLRGAIQQQIDAAGLARRFHLVGFCSDLDRYYPHLDVLALPSYTEGLPNVVLEAFAAGVPVVATAVGGTPELVSDGINGYLVAPGDADALAERILAVLSDDERRNGMGRLGQQLVRGRFSFSSQAGEYRRLLNDLVTLPVASRAQPPCDTRVPASL
jgi:glycosyltransferase involved in cell wall biosynthesis